MNLLGEKDYTAIRRIRNNAAGTYSVGWYSVHVATEGNTRISEAHVVN